MASTTPHRSRSCRPSRGRWGVAAPRPADHRKLAIRRGDRLGEEVRRLVATHDAAPGFAMYHDRVRCRCHHVASSDLLISASLSTVSMCNKPSLGRRRGVERSGSTGRHVMLQGVDTSTLTRVKNATGANTSPSSSRPAVTRPCRSRSASKRSARATSVARSEAYHARRARRLRKEQVEHAFHNPSTTEREDSRSGVADKGHRAPRRHRRVRGLHVPDCQALAPSSTVRETTKTKSSSLQRSCRSPVRPRRPSLPPAPRGREQQDKFLELQPRDDQSELVRTSDEVVRPKSTIGLRSFRMFRQDSMTWRQHRRIETAIARRPRRFFASRPTQEPGLESWVM